MKRQTLACLAERSSVVARGALIDEELVSCADEEAVLVGVDAVNAGPNRALKHVGLELACVFADYHLTVVRAHKNAPGVLRPGVARVVVAQVAAFLHVVDLCVLGLENQLRLFLLAFGLLRTDVLVRVRTRNHDC